MPLATGNTGLAKTRSPRHPTQLHLSGLRRTLPQVRAGIAPRPTPGEGAPRSSGPAAALAVVALLLATAAIGASAEHGTGRAELDRQGASIVLSILATLALLVGATVFARIIWALLTGGRGPDGSASRRRSPRAAWIALVAIGLFFLVLVATADRRHPGAATARAAQVGAVGQARGGAIPFNATASGATAAVVLVGALVLGVAWYWRAVAWRRAFAAHWAEAPTVDDVATGNDVEMITDLSSHLSAVSLAGSIDEPDPRRAVVACYLAMLDAASRAGADRRSDETPTEFLRRVLAFGGVGEAPATRLTAAFERARYSDLPVGEPLRTEAVGALAAVRADLAALEPTAGSGGRPAAAGAPR